MKDQERQIMHELLGTVDLITSETHKPAELRQIVKSIPNTPPPTVYAWVDRAVGYGLMQKSVAEGGYKAVAITLKGYRMLGKQESIAVKPVEVAQGLLTYKQAYHIIKELLGANEGLGASEIGRIMNVMETLIKE